MTKNEIIAFYKNATIQEKNNLTKVAREWLRDSGFPVTRQAVKKWRDSQTNTSVLKNYYRCAYTIAIGHLKNINSAAMTSAEQ